MHTRKRLSETFSYLNPNILLQCMKIRKLNIIQSCHSIVLTSEFTFSIIISTKKVQDSLYNFYHISILSFLDAISENQPRVIDDSRARKLASDLKRCSYYETCATYGLNVERVFQDGN